MAPRSIGETASFDRPSASLAPDERDGPPGGFDRAFRDGLHEAMRWRRDVRRFRTDPVPEAALASALRSFDLAPSVGNSQPWRLVIVGETSRRRQIAENFERCNQQALGGGFGAGVGAGHQPEAEREDGERRRALYARLKLAGLQEAPVHMAVFCDPQTRRGHGLGTRTMPQAYEHSVAGAVALFALAARTEGLGVGWVSILQPDEVRSALDVPAAWRLIAYLCIGYPAKEDDVPELERVGWQARRRRTPIIRR